MLNDENLVASSKRSEIAVPTPSELKDFFKAFDNAVAKVIGLNAPEGMEAINTEIYYSHIDTIKEYGGFLALVGKENYEKVAFSIAIELEKYEASQNTIEKLFDPKKAKQQIEKDLNIAKKFRQSLGYNELEKTIGTDDQYDEYGKYGEIINPLPSELFIVIRATDLYINALADYLTEGKLNPNMFPIDKYMTKPKKTKTSMKNLIGKILTDYKIQNYSAEAKKLVDRLE